MKQFLNDNDAAFRDLKAKAQNSCVVFQNQEMPPGTRPQFLRIGFEIDAEKHAFLLVDTGATYSGDNQTVKKWLENGTKEFANFEELRHWIESELKPEYNKIVAVENIPVTPLSPPIESLSNFAEVQNVVKPHSLSVRVSPKELFTQLSQEVRGQDESLQRLCNKVSRHLARTNPRRPATVFAVGPTGVGKTQTAETLAKSLSRLIPNCQTFHYLRLDMSEYQESHRVSQLLGAPQGYIGYGEGSQLLDALTIYPNCIVLFDEIEKAHPDILRTLMNAMDAGRISSPHQNGGNRQIDCRKAIFYFTSNLESSGILQEVEAVKDNGQTDWQTVDEICRKHLKKGGVSPELVGRIGSFLIYQELDDTARTEILALSIVRVASEYGLNIFYIMPETLTAMLKMIPSSNFGVRPDEYFIDELLGGLFIESLDEFGNAPLELRGAETFNCFLVNENN